MKDTLILQLEMTDIIHFTNFTRSHSSSESRSLSLSPLSGNKVRPLTQLPHLTSLPRFWTLSSMLVNTVRIHIKKQDLGICIIPNMHCECSQNSQNDRFVVFLEDHTIVQKFGAETCQFSTRTMHGFARSYCTASSSLASWREMATSDTHTWSSRASSHAQCHGVHNVSEIEEPLILHVVLTIACNCFRLLRIWILPKFFSPSHQWHKTTWPSLSSLSNKIFFFFVPCCCSHRRNSVRLSSDYRPRSKCLGHPSDDDQEAT